MQKLFAIALLFTAMLFSTAAISAPIECNTCDFSAANKKALTAGAGTHYVYNFSTRQIWGFQVTYIAKIRSFTSKNVQVDANYVTAFLKLATYWQQNGGSLKTDLTIRPGDGNYPPAISDGSAWLAATTFAERNFYLASFPAYSDVFPNNTFLDGVDSLISQLATGYFGFELTVTVYFADGSSIKIAYNKGNSQTPVYVEGSAKDSDGNPIPDGSVASNPAQFQGVYVFSTQSNLNNFLFAARVAGIPITNGPPTGNVRSFVCNITPSGGLSCKPV
jgi:hypothetical protein